MNQLFTRNKTVPGSEEINAYGNFLSENFSFSSFFRKNHPQLIYTNQERTKYKIYYSYPCENNLSRLYCENTLDYPGDIETMLAKVGGCNREIKNTLHNILQRGDLYIDLTSKQETLADQKDYSVEVKDSRLTIQVPPISGTQKTMDDFMPIVHTLSEAHAMLYDTYRYENQKQTRTEDYANLAEKRLINGPMKRAKDRLSEALKLSLEFLDGSIFDGKTLNDRTQEVKGLLPPSYTELSPRGTYYTANAHPRVVRGNDNGRG